MATKKKAPKSFARWYTKYTADIIEAARDGDDMTAQHLIEKREADAQYFKDSIKLLRKFTTGFKPADGYDLNAVKFLTPQQVAKIRREASYLRQAMSGPHATVSPRTIKGKSALRRELGQDEIRTQKRFIVPLDTPPDRTSVTFRKGRLNVVETLPDGTRIEREFFGFPDKPRSFAHIVRMTRKMLGNMPPGYYMIRTDRQGTISAPLNKDRLMQQLRDEFSKYERFSGHEQFAEAIIGFQRVGGSFDEAAAHYRQKKSIREQYRDETMRQRRAERRKVLTRLRRGKRAR